MTPQIPLDHPVRAIRPTRPIRPRRAIRLLRPTCPNRKRARWSSTALLTALLATPLAPVSAEPGMSARLSVEESDTYGLHLVDAAGKPLYLFTADQQGEAQRQAKSHCQDDCAAMWPPMLTWDEARIGEGIDASLVGTLERDDGAKQVTYDGWPLYSYVKDGSDQIRGQDVRGFGGEWYLIQPNGEKVERESEHETEED